MLTKLTLRKFKRFEAAEIELGDPVVFIGPNNSGKTTALQAIALWDLGVKKWNEKRKGKGKANPQKRPGVTINRRDLIALPVSAANLLWRDLHVRSVSKTNGQQQTQNIRVEVIIEGVSDGKSWECGVEFDYANTESFYCRPLKEPENTTTAASGLTSARMSIPEAASALKVAFLPPMSGLASNETRLDPGAINVRLGEGRTAEVLRNLCYQLLQTAADEWQAVCRQIEQLFGVKLDEPIYIQERGEIQMSYRESSGIVLDLSSSGRGLQQTLLLLAHLSLNPNSVLLLDEPDAHLEILRQRQIYQSLMEAARTNNCQIIAASHSEVVLNEAAGKDVVVAFLGTPHRIGDRKSQLLKSLKELGFDQYYQAEQRGWVLYVEGSTDLSILQTFAEKLAHPAQDVLDSPFVHYISNQPSKARDHFHGLREAKPNLVGFVLTDRLEQPPNSSGNLDEQMWSRREFENYLCQPETLLAYANDFDRTKLPLIDQVEKERRESAMNECIGDFVPRIALQDRADAWWKDTKMSDEFLDRLFPRFFEKLGLPNLMRKTDYHTLARLVPVEHISPEISEMLDAILATAKKAVPLI